MIRPIWYLSPDEMGGAGTADAGGATAQNEGAENDATEQGEAGADSSAGTQNTGTAGGDKAPKQKSDYVPYDRFHEVNSKYRDEIATRARLEGEVTHLKDEIARIKQSAGSQEQIDPEARRTIDYYTDKMVNPAVKPLTQRLEKLEGDLKARDESQKLEKAIGEMETKYPVIKDAPYAMNMLRNEYILNPNAKLDDMAKSISDYLTGRDKRTIAGYIKGKTNDAQHKGGNPAGAGVATKPAPLPKDASVNDIFRRARDSAVARLENAGK